MKSVKPIQAINPVFALIVLVVIGLTTVLLATPYYPLALLPGFAVILILVMGRFPEYGYYFIIFCLPFQGLLNISDDYGFLTIPKIIGILILIVLAFRFTVNKTKPIDAKSNLWISLIIFFAINFLTACSSDYPVTSFDTLRRMITAYAFFFLTLIFINRYVYSYVLPKILIGATCISAVLSFFGYIFNIPMITVSVNSELKRAAVGEIGPNVFCMILVFTLPIIAHFFFHEDRPFRRVIFGGLFAVNLIASMLTYSRSGFFVGLIVLCLLGINYFTKLKPRHIGFVTLFLLLGIIVAYISIPESYKYRIQSSTDVKTDASIGRRATYLLVAKDAFIKKPLFGYGPGTFSEIYARSTYAQHFSKWARMVAREKKNKKPAHNAYVEVIVGTGILGFVIYMIIVGIAFRNFSTAKAIFLKNKRSDMVSITNAYQYCFIAVLVTFLFYSGQYHKYFWISLGLSQVALTIAKQTSRQTAQQPSTSVS
jgi:putative inorganic carbon (HCO3(-)) transporter